VKELNKLKTLSGKTMKLTSKKAFKVAKYLLEHPKTSQLELSNKTDVALGYVNEIVNYLYDLNMVSKKSRACVLDDPVRLLEKISFERPLKRLEAATFRLPTTFIRESEETIRNICQKKHVRYTLTVFSGLKRYYEYHISYPSVHAYVSDISIGEQMEHGEGAIPITLLKPDRSDILNESNEINGFHVCDRIQIIVDLFSSGLGRDAAIKFLEVVQHGDHKDTG
jgi:hypothetical protein